jgi:hypothetical protein
MLPPHEAADLNATRIRRSLRGNRSRPASRRGTPPAHRHKPRPRGLTSRPRPHWTQDQDHREGVLQ